MKRYNMRDVTPYVTVHPDGEWVRYEDHVAALAQQPQGEINQCDGCMSGAELREGRHHSADGRAFMLCQAERYAAPPQAAPVAQGLMLTGDQIRAAVRDARMTCGPSDAPQPADYVQAGARAILAQAAPSASAQQADGVPMGAIENGRTLADRLEAYPFESEAGDLRMCSDWQEFRRCFEHLATWAMSAAPAPSARASRDSFWKPPPNTDTLYAAAD